MNYETCYYSSSYTLLIKNNFIGGAVKYFDLDLPLGIIPGTTAAAFSILEVPPSPPSGTGGTPGVVLDPTQKVGQTDMDAGSNTYLE
jgi:hypothetical protein